MKISKPMNKEILDILSYQRKLQNDNAQLRDDLFVTRAILMFVTAFSTFIWLSSVLIIKDTSYCMP